MEIFPRFPYTDLITRVYPILPGPLFMLVTCAMASTAGSPGYMSNVNAARNYNVSPAPEMKYSTFLSSSPHSQQNFNGHHHAAYPTMPPWMTNDPSLQWSMNMTGTNCGGDMYSGRNSHAHAAAAVAAAQYWPGNFSSVAATTASNTSNSQQSGHISHVVNIPQHCYPNHPQAAAAYLQHPQQSSHQSLHQQAAAPCNSPPSLSHYVNANYGHNIMHHPSESTSPNLVGCELINRTDGSLSSGEEEHCNGDGSPSVLATADLEQFAKQFKQRRIKLGKFPQGILCKF